MLLKLPAENLAIPLKVIHNGMKNPQQVRVRVCSHAWVLIDGLGHAPRGVSC